jgi:hypothetical protein
VVVTGFHDLVHAIRFKRVELAVEQGPPAELDQALGPIVDEVAKARTLSGGKDDGFHVRLSVDFAPTAFQMRP